MNLYIFIKTQSEMFSFDLIEYATEGVHIKGYHVIICNMKYAGDTVLTGWGGSHQQSCTGTIFFK